MYELKLYTVLINSGLNITVLGSLWHSSFQCLLIGDSEGQVTVLQLRSMPAPPPPEKQVYISL